MPAAAPPPAVEAAGLVRRHGGRTIIDHVELSIPAGQLFGLLGPSGSGKTTLIKLLTGIDRADAGQAAVFGSPVPDLSVLKEIGYMAQSDALYNELTGKQNMAFFGALYGLKGKRLQERIASSAGLVALTGELGKQVGAYSGGMKRRLSLAIALLHEPKLLVLDEPTVGIDPLLRQSIWQELAALRTSGVTLIVTTHVMDEAEKCDRLGMLRDGRLIAAGSPAELLKRTGSVTLEEAFIAFGENGGETL
ncbi:ABC transporter ATP-binding protein [Paenibacillus sp. NPDC058071]|uniref:ABC transporter ATP-binding protein n=1 Tax=Paenibacillus sp. NPDC058071 TaxID=3346326 RepID=UPI0036DB654A